MNTNTSTKPEWSIITVNYNGADLTAALIESLRKHLSCNYEVIVVDNGSRRDEAALLQARFPEIIALRSEQNRGFAGGNNLGIQRAEGKWLLLLNNDTYLTDNSLSALPHALENHPDWAIVCPKIRFAATNHPIQFAGYTALTPITLRNRLIGFNEPDTGQYDTPHTTPYAHGAAMMIRRTAIEEVGEMPECYFLYYEELDWSERFTRAGWKIGYEPSATVFHCESASTGQNSPLRVFYLTRNRLLFGWRNRRGVIRLLSLVYQLGVAIPKGVVTELLHKNISNAKAALRGCCAFFSLPDKTR